MKGLKRFTCMLLVTAMVFSLVACGKSGDSGNKAADNGGAYITREVELPGKDIYLENFAVANDVVYFTYYDSNPYMVETEGSVESEETDQEPNSKTKLARVEADGSNYTEISYERKLDDIQGISVDDQGNIWLLEFSYAVSDSAADDSEEDAAAGDVRENGTQEYALVKIDADGKEQPSYTDLSAILSPGAEGEMASPQDMAIDKDGNIYLSVYFSGENSDKSCVCVLDSGGKELFELEVDYVDEFVRTAQGAICLPTYESFESEGFLVKEIDVSKKAWGKEYSIGSNYYYGIFSGTDYDFTLYDGSKLYGYDIKSEKTTTILDTLSAGVTDSYFDNVAALSEGRFIYISYDYESNGTSLMLLVPVDEELNANKTEITLACYYLDSALRSKIAKFNNDNEEYKISVTDYSTYSTVEDWNAGITKLNTEITAGNIPDIICSSEILPTQQYAKKGLLEDLYPYIDNDEELSRDSFLPNILRALETDGKLYEMASSFYLSSLVGNSDIVGTEMGWTFDELMAVSDSLAEGATLFGPYFTKSLLIEYIMYAISAQFVDWSAGKCSFDSANFIRLLELANTLPTEYEHGDEDEQVDEYTLLYEGRQVLSTVALTSPQMMQMYNKMFNGKANYIGFPVSEGVGTTISLGLSVGITTASKHKDAAWEFIRELFTEEYQSEIGFGIPTNKAGFDAAMKKSMEKELDDDGNEISTGGMAFGGGFTFEFYAATQEEVDQFTALIDSASGTTNYNPSLNEIITEETTAYFEGAQTAKRTAEIIQDRVTKYINE